MQVSVPATSADRLSLQIFENPNYGYTRKREQFYYHSAFPH